MVKSTMQKIDTDFTKDIKDVLKKRITLGKDDPLKPLSMRRVTSYIKNHPAWQKIKNDLTLADRMDKKGQLTDIFVFMAMAVVIALFFGLFIFAFHGVSSVLVGLNQTNISGNMSIGSASALTIGQIDNDMPIVRTLAFVLILGMIITILLSNFLVRVHPAFFFLYLLVTMIAVIVSVYLANFYETMLSDVVFGPSLQAMTGTNFILLNLPYIVAVVGIFGLIFLTIGIIQRPDYRNTAGVLS